jgi:Flp pilus assembly protein TadD
MRHTARIALLATFLFALSAFAQEQVPAAGSADDFSKATFFGARFFELNDFASAYEQFARADAINPDQPAIIYNLALLLAKLGRFSEAQV